MFLPNDLATCALIKILWDFQNPTPPRKWENDPKWALTPAQEKCRELAARICGGC
jgi:hypothetical protein